jgi:amidase
LKGQAKTTTASQFDALEQAQLVRQGEISATELITDALTQAERLNPSLNAIITPLSDEALEQGKTITPGDPRLFAGVPFLLKDLLASYAGARLTEGSRFLGEFVPRQDSELVARLRRAGLIVIGKTNTPEFGILGTTEPLRFGPTHNPWDYSRSPGGSSGGSAAAVAAGIVPMAHANDGGGSIRIPASCCGIFGLKPARARNPLGPDHGDLFSGLVVEHAVTRSVRDSAALLDVTAGPAPGDPYGITLPKRSYLKEAGRDPGRLRIAVSVSSPSGTPVHPLCAEATWDAARLCEELGHIVEPAEPRLHPERFTQAFDTVWSAGIASVVEEWCQRLGRRPAPSDLEPTTWAVWDKGLSVSAPKYLLAVSELQLVTRQMAMFLNDFDVWLTPTVSLPPPPLGYFDPTPDQPLRGYERDAAFCPFTPVANATGLPAMSVPLWWDEDGLPIGVHFTGRYADEATLIRLAAQLERARPWRHRTPEPPG